MLFGIRRVVVRGDIVRLHVEDEIGRALLLGKGSRLEQFNFSNVEEPPKDRVHGQQRGGHPARGLQKISARETSSSCGPFHERDDKLFNAGLVRCLAEGSKFFVGDDLCRNGGSKVNSLSSRRKVRKWFW